MHTNMIRVFVAGFVTTIVLTVTMYLISPFLGGGLVGTVTLVNGLLVGSLFGGILFHFLVGTLVLPAVYGLVAYPLLTGSPTVRGATWGLVLWLVSQAVVMPILGGGFFSARAGGLVSAIDSLIGHLAYGVVLGALAGRVVEVSPRRVRRIGSRAQVPRIG